MTVTHVSGHFCYLESLLVHNNLGRLRMATDPELPTTLVAGSSYWIPALERKRHDGSASNQVRTRCLLDKKR